MNLTDAKRLIDTLVSYPYKMTVYQWHVFFIVAASPGVSVSQLVKDEKITGRPSDVSITVARLSEGRSDRLGLGLFNRVKDAHDKRSTQLFLSQKGERLLLALQEHIR